MLPFFECTYDICVIFLSYDFSPMISHSAFLLNDAPHCIHGAPVQNELFEAVGRVHV